MSSPEQQAAEAAAICSLVNQTGKLPEAGGIGLDVAGELMVQTAMSPIDLLNERI